MGPQQYCVHCAWKRECLQSMVFTQTKKLPLMPIPTCVTALDRHINFAQLQTSGTLHILNNCTCEADTQYFLGRESLQRVLKPKPWIGGQSFEGLLPITKNILYIRDFKENKVMETIENCRTKTLGNKRQKIQSDILQLL